MQGPFPLYQCLTTLRPDKNTPFRFFTIWLSLLFAPRASTYFFNTVSQTTFWGNAALYGPLRAGLDADMADTRQIISCIPADTALAQESVIDKMKYLYNRYPGLYLYLTRANYMLNIWRYCVIMSAERINSLFHALGCSNSEIARRSGCSASYISRLRSGSRRSVPASISLRKVAEALCGFADERGAGAVLRRVCGEDSVPSAEALHLWLCCGDTEGVTFVDVSPRKVSVPLRRRKDYVFGERLDEAMSALSLSNVRLARLVNVDPSYICRLRSGERSPKAGCELIRLLAGALLDLSRRQGREGVLSELCGIGEKGLACNGGFILASWLCGGTADTGAVGAMLDYIDSFSPGDRTGLPSFSEVATPEILNKRQEMYMGTDGLREAVVRFLGTAALSGGELWLYSDEDMDWMTGDEGYFYRWYALMLECVKRGVKVRIIHNIDRGEEEMISAVQSWLPLYMSGMIEPFVCRRRRNERFAHTLFLSPGNECIFSSHVRRSEGVYLYCTDSVRLSAFETEYKRLLSFSKPLVKVNMNPQDALCWRRGASCEISHSLPFDVMPERLLKRMLDRNKIPREQAEAVMALCRTAADDLKNVLSDGEKIEFAPLAELAEISAGKTAADIPALSSEAEIYYEDDEYAEHVKALIDTVSGCPNYRFCSIQEASLRFVRIIKYHDRILVTRLKKPYAEFTFTEPLMLKAFSDYFAFLVRRYGMDTNILLEKLRGYL